MSADLGQLAVTTTAAVLLLSPLLLLAYQAGRQANSTGKSVRFDRVRSDVFLNGTQWRGEFDSDDGQSGPQIVTLIVRQVGGRIFGEGQSSDGRWHSFEGVLAGRRLCYVALDDERHVEWLGTVSAEVLPGEREMIGMRARWSGPLQPKSGQSQTVNLRKVTFSRLNDADSIQNPNVNP